MELIKWSSQYELGIEEIDNQHKGLVIIINELFSLMSQGKAKNNLDKIFDHLTDYTKKHFLAEEVMLFKFGYKEFDNHKDEHKKFVEKLNDLKKDMSNGDVTTSLKVLNFLKDWLLNNIQISDKKYSSFILSKM